MLAPTREIALQASEAVALCAAALPPPGLACGSFIGGLRVEEDEKQLRRWGRVAVCPGMGHVLWGWLGGCRVRKQLPGVAATVLEAGLTTAETCKCTQQAAG